jgi:hypothetical protein
MNKDSFPYAEYVTNDQMRELQETLEAYPDAASCLAALGDTLGASATGEDPEELGRQVLSRRMHQLHQDLCGLTPLRDFCSSASVVDSITAGGSILGALIASNFHGINVVIVAAALTRIGLRAICEKVWKNNEIGEGH